MRLTNLTLSANGCDSVKFLGLVGWGDESLWKEKRMRSASQKRAHCSNLCIVTAKRRVTHIYVTICLGFFFPHKFPFLLPPSVLPSGEEAALWRWGFLFEKSGRQSRGCFNRLYKYLHPHGLTPWTTYYSISLSLPVSSGLRGRQTCFFTSATHPLHIPRSLHSYDCRVPPQSRPALIWLGIHEAS